MIIITKDNRLINTNLFPVVLVVETNWRGVNTSLETHAVQPFTPGNNHEPEFDPYTVVWIGTEVECHALIALLAIHSTNSHYHYDLMVKHVERQTAIDDNVAFWQRMKQIGLDVPENAIPPDDESVTE